MKQLTTKGSPADGAAFEIGKILGQSIAFGTMAGRSSAAQAAAIRQARTEKVHARFRLTWKEFCPKHLKMSGTQADEIIRLLEEFGPDYFEYTQSVRISASTYRLVAPFIKEKALHFQDEVLELNSANVQRVAGSVRESQRALLPAPPAPAAVPILSERLDAVTRRAMGVIDEFREVARDAHETEPSLLFQSMFRGSLLYVNAELARLGHDNGCA